MNEFQVFAQREKQGWAEHQIVDAYVQLFGPVTDVSAKVMVEREGGPNRQILDLCCGQGSLTSMLCESGSTVSGLDFSSTMLELASRSAPGATLHQGDAAELPFSDQSFDAVLCNFGMMHLPDQPKALAEIRRVLKPPGRFVMATWASPDISPAFGIVFGSIKSNADFSEAPPQPDLFAFSSPSVAEEMFRVAGLTLAKHEYVTGVWELDRPEKLFEIFLNATVGAAMLIKSQTQETIDKIKADMTQNVAANYQAGDTYKVPVSIAIVTAE